MDVNLCAKCANGVEQRGIAGVKCAVSVRQPCREADREVIERLCVPSFWAPPHVLFNLKNDPERNVLILDACETPFDSGWIGT